MEQPVKRPGKLTLAQDSRPGGVCMFSVKLEAFIQGFSQSAQLPSKSLRGAPGSLSQRYRDNKVVQLFVKKPSSA
eukprot:scaffold3427_cov18-Tisochrysis_lutea.AAC.1